MIDLLVAGAGPVGLVTAIHGALSGLDVTVVEPRAAPIDKACGEGLMPDAVAHLSRIGVDPEGLPFHGIRYLSGTHVAQARFSAGPGRGVRRTVLDAHLVERARVAGVTFAQGRVLSLEVGAGYVEACGVRARYLVGADGLHSDVRRLAGLARPARGAARFGLRQHFIVEPWTDLVEVHWLPDAEVYVTPVGERLVGVAVLGCAPLDLRGTLERLPALKARLAGAEPATRPRGAGPLRQQATGRCAGRVLLVGDAAGYVDALTGEGLRVGFVEAEAVVRAVLRNDPEAYAAQWPRITRSYRWLTNGLLWTASRPRLRTMIVPAARAMPFAFRRIVDSLAA